MQEYWNQRFLNEGFIWGTSPSQTAEHAKNIFLEYHIKNILVPGAGYGRNTKLLSQHFKVDAIELSQKAVEIAQTWDTLTHFAQGDVLQVPIHTNQYDAVYCYDLLHLLKHDARMKLIQKCMDSLTHDGLYYFTGFSDEDEAYQTGAEIEPNTFEYKKGKIAHFFSKEDLVNHFKNTRIIEMGTYTEILNYSDESSRNYRLRYIFGIK